MIRATRIAPPAPKERVAPVDAAPCCRLSVLVLQTVVFAKAPLITEAVAAIVFRGDPDVANRKRPTVWRTLNKLERGGLVERLTPRGGYSATEAGRRVVMPT